MKSQDWKSYYTDYIYHDWKGHEPADGEESEQLKARENGIQACEICKHSIVR